MRIPKKVDIIQGILASYNLTPCEAVMVGDGASDYQAAVQTGLHIVARETREQSEYWQQDRVPIVIGDLNTFSALLG